MRLLNFKLVGAQYFGVSLDRGIVNVSALIADGISGLPSSTDDAARSPEKMRCLQNLIESEEIGQLVSEMTIEFAPAVLRPEKIIGIGLNYMRHVIESGAQEPAEPLLFAKFATGLSASGEDIPLPETAMTDYEAELALVIGKTASAVSVEDALGFVFGYCACNDLTERDLQGRSSQWLLGKAVDKFLPIGPYVVTSDEVGDPQQLQIRCRVNGELRQNSSTSDMLFSCAELISYVSQHITLKPGDVILTGTPEGVAMGMSGQPWLVPGDEVVVEVSNLGRLENRMIRP
ncbi:MAG: fumarylacetoacetate hydrolase family protein [Pseudomonadales bacterium]